MSYWIDDRGNRIEISKGIACRRGQGGGCLEEPVIDHCRQIGEVEAIVQQYAELEGWESHLNGLFGL